MSVSTLESQYGLSPSQRAWLRFRSNPIAMTALSVFLLILAVALVFGLFRLLKFNWPYDPDATDLTKKLSAPNAEHWLGTDNLGRDVLTRLLHGSYVSLTVGFVAVFVAMTIGILVGSVAGYFRGWVDNILMRFVDAMICFPEFFVILTVVAILGPNIINVIIVIGIFSWTGTARLVRAEFLTLREMQYVAAARTLGQGWALVIFRHILPNALPPILVTAVVSIPGAIMTEAGLSYLGFGVQPPQASWGNIIADGRTYFLDAWWLIVFPGIAIFVTVLAFYIVADSFRRAFDRKN